ncbi:hypothetical protein [Herbiconiux ginsengi]|uniref:Uncharacterized protein n=1 Tax=Herbiconiux ginsengi TaxID=381665 RepID=A0A1H3RZI8_9MICO|nr:hypothetical protein [Herbiconiux ginsengi]SDZ31092.1 hypothetical protein SAMN05216554_3196 [Herbiconiux ginsengi]
MQFGRQLTPDEFWTHVDETDARLRSTFAPTHAFGLVRWPGFSMVTEWDFGGQTRVLSYARAMPAVIPPSPRADEDPAAVGGFASDRDGYRDSPATRDHADADDDAATLASLEARLTGAGGSAAAEGASTVAASAAALSDPFDVHVHWRTGDSRAVVDRLRHRESLLQARTTSWYRPVSPTEHLPDRIVDLKVDGRREPFEVWVRGAVWWAATTLGGRTLAVVARDVPFEDVALLRVTDIEPYIDGRRLWLRRMRGEA